jgi:hypothetical protein
MPFCKYYYCSIPFSTQTNEKYCSIKCRNIQWATRKRVIELFGKQVAQCNHLTNKIQCNNYTLYDEDFCNAHIELYKNNF